MFIMKTLKVECLEEAEGEVLEEEGVVCCVCVCGEGRQLRGGGVEVARRYGC